MFKKSVFFIEITCVKCFQSEDIFKMTNLTTIQTAEEFERICPIMLYNFEIGNCEYQPLNEDKLSIGQVWLYGLLLSGVVTIWSWNGAVVLPIINKKFYKRILTFMISLAFGTMTSNSLLKYIPLVFLLH